MRDAPDIRMTEETGWPVPVTWPRCPVCGEECDTFYRDREGEIFGCENCVQTLDAWEVLDE